MRNAVSFLQDSGKPKEAKRIRKVAELLEEFPGMSSKKQQKALRKILRLIGEMAGVRVGRPCSGLCGQSVCCNVACVVGTALLMGAIAVLYVVFWCPSGEYDAGDFSNDK